MRQTAYERHLDRAHAAVTRRMRSCAEALAGDITRTPVAGVAVRSLRAQVAETLSRHHTVFSSGFDEALKRSYGQLARPAVPARPPTLDELEIMDDARVQEEIEVAQVVQILGADSGMELRRLLQFESALRRSEGVRVTSSPIGPPALARALWQGSEGLNLGLAARAEAVRGAARWLAPSLGEVYDAVRKAGVAEVVLVDDAPAGGAGSDVPEFAPPTGFDVTRPGALFELLGLDELRPSVNSPQAPAFPAIADTEPMPLDGGDPRIPGLIQRHRGELAALQDESGPRLVRDLIGRLFDRILADPALSADARAWIGRLQPSVVRLATNDATLLQSHRHPAWTLVNRIVTQMGSDDRPPAPDFLQWLTATVAQVAADPSASAFESACDRLTQWQRAQAGRRLTGAESALELLRRNASLETHVNVARARLQRKVESTQPPPTVKRFVLTVWSLVCAQEASARRADEPRTSAAMDVAVDLIWSTDAARSRVDAPTLLAMMPGLVDRLTAGMATVGVSDAHRDAWLGQLAELHLKALRRPVGATAASGPITVDLRLDDALPEDEAAAEEPLFRARPADARDPVQELQVGDSIGIQLHGDWVDLQLIWMSDNGNFLLFAHPREGGSHSFTRRALLKMQAEGLLRSVEARSALERATDEIVRRRG